MNIEINMPENVKYIINTLMTNGYEAYVVGGCVRDSILNREPKDWDITTKAKPEEVINLFDKVILTGLKHGTVTVIINKENYEITTYRTDGEYEDNRHPKEVKFVNSLKEDLARRDFTINAMAYNERDGIIDYFNGVKDLNSKIINTVGEAKKRFEEDALRMLRAIRFSAQLNFEINYNVLEAIKDLKDNLRKISKERIREEFNKTIVYNPRKLQLLKDTETFEYIIEGISSIYDFDQNNPYHSYDLYEHTLLATEAIEPIIHLRLTMLLHDLGKVVTKTTDEKGISHFYAHPRESLKIAEKILGTLKYDNNTTNKVLTLIEYHDCTLKSKVSIKRMLNKIGEELFRDLLRVKWADALAQNPKYFKDTVKNLLEVDEKLNIIIKERECFSVKDLKINGEELIALGFNKGKEIGETLKYLLNEVIANPELNKKSELIKLSEARLNENSII
ncbi:CCA tRNA nucleotidyltransferase [Clostridium saccharoperbutylacetonicum]|uniref:CCA tRNA nucleotidyltransferase n=1 Tax=Clostridium saccharoperbutylacetonicum TaxID=36745 RepID=UPI000983CBD7|nr:CCA tRNA nucleotidyltransferase [Clostridium saccharoperbutylacetonicum]AQR95279.1 CCA-adding enzyme [Clostridium saccharoperbutylacetonicum]NSB31134.1 tRNA nucleotidyltransferase (CCA-adding enzyme) [Clostridium saccharoperbutylacetonicum]